MSEATENFWKGEFGDSYTRRNEGMIDRNVAFFGRALRRVQREIKTVLEFGCGTGQNLKALERLLGPHVETHGIEINDEAANLACSRANGIISKMPVREWVRAPSVHWDLVLSKGFLIHVSPDELPEVYTKMFEASHRYILLAEYYNPTPLEVIYRGAAGRLWKRDFATEMIGLFPSLRVADYGFVWRYDYPWQQDDITYFLLEKR